MKTRFFTWNEWLGRAECPYARRWILNLGICTIRVHHWLAADDARHHHDHPWWFITFVLKGEYIDMGESVDYVGAGNIRFRPALHRHYVLPRPNTWTVLLTGRPRRQWGFWVKGKFKKSTRYFFDFGHPPCEDKEHLG